MKNQKPTKNEQIEALLEHKAYELVEKYSNNLHDSLSYETVFNITTKDILEYVTKNHNIDQLLLAKTNNLDGFYVIPSRFGYRIYEQYQGIIANDSFVFTTKQVLKKYVDYLIRTSGTGLEFK